jgi:hypothetical protein
MTAMDVSSTTANAILKEYYTNQRVTQLMYKESPFYAMLTKHKDFFGESYPIPLKVANPQGRSNTFANAQSAKTPSQYRAFALTRAKDYSLASITTEAILASESNAGAFLKLATGEIDGALESLKRSICWALYGDGTGSLGQVNAALTSGTTVTMKYVDDIVKIEVGQILNIYSAASGGSIRTSDGTTTALTVLTVDRDAGTFTVDDTFTGSSTVAADDHIFVLGDRGAKLSGLAAWIPSSAPSSTAFFGVDRTVDVTRLAGSRQSATTKPIDEALVDMARRIGREGGSPDTVMMGFSKYASLEKTLMNRVEYVDTEVAGIAFRGIKVSGPKGAITVYPDQDCPTIKAYMLKLDSWGFYSLKDPVMLVDLDGNKMLREGSADAFEVRAATYSNLATNEPRSNGVISFT